MRPTTRHRWIGAAALAAALLVAGACTSDDAGSAPSDPSPAADDPAPADRDSDDGSSADRSDPGPEGPAATIDRELTEGSVFLAAGTTVDLDAAGYVEHEHQLSGTAVSHEGDTPADGFWDLVETGETGDYTTRIVVRRPADPADASGVVLLEWLNVSGGLDANPDFAYLAPEILRSGHIWIGVSAQHIGIEGGPTVVSLPGTESITGTGLRKLNPERYGELRHPGDGFAYDIFTQIARAVRSDDGRLLGDVEPELVLAVGESQSAFALTTYVDGIQPLTRIFDGFFIHSRGGPPLPLTPTGDRPVADITGSLTGEPTRIRTDLDVPVLQFQSESDVEGVLGFAAARQDDTDRIRTWEVAGTAHVDRYMLGIIADGAGCEPDLNDGPHSLTARAALRALVTWAREGTPPPTADPLELDDDAAQIRDEHGIAVGGIRTPLVDVPVDALRGDAADGASIFCSLAGRTIPLDAAVLTDLHGDAESYLAAFEASADDTIGAGFVLPEDRDELLAAADPDRFG